MNVLIVIFSILIFSLFIKLLWVKCITNKDETPSNFLNEEKKTYIWDDNKVHTENEF